MFETHPVEVRCHFFSSLTTDEITVAPKKEITIYEDSGCHIRKWLAPGLGNPAIEGGAYCRGAI